LCQRYLPAFSASATTDTFLGYSYATNNALYVCNFQVAARVPPTGIAATGTFYGLGLNTPYTTSVSFWSGNSFAGWILGTPTITAGQGSRMTMASGALLLFTGCEL